MSCQNIIDICVTRGTTFTFDVGLTDTWTEVIENPEDYVAVMVFRETQDANAIVYLTTSATAEVVEDPTITDLPAYFRFEIDSAETASLPDYNHVYYVDLQPAVVVGTPEITRLFEGKVEVHD